MQFENHNIMEFVINNQKAELFVVECSNIFIVMYVWFGFMDAMTLS